MAAGSAGERLATTETLCPLSSGEVDERVGESLDVAGSSGESELQYLDTGTGAAASVGTGAAASAGTGATASVGTGAAASVGTAGEGRVGAGEEVRQCGSFFGLPGFRF